MPIINNSILSEDVNLKKCLIFNEDEGYDTCWIPEEYCTENSLVRFEFCRKIWRIMTVYNIEVSSDWLIVA
jgi:hypothetical protein